MRDKILEMRKMLEMRVIAGHFCERVPFFFGKVVFLAVRELFSDFGINCSRNHQKTKKWRYS